MSINSDFSKLSATPLQTGQGNQLSEQEFVKEKQMETQVVQQTADSNPMDSEAENGSNLAGSKQEVVDEPKVEEVNVKMRQLSLGVSFELTEESEKIVKVIDQETGDLVRQIPSEEFLKMSQRLDEIFGELNSLKGNLVNSEV
ncbi:MAG: flagellar biosynthesis protein FlaG [Marinomonas sp.]|nr:MAG: flagellar biosynthesis protein FlaG [Marinomonas sp.]